MLNQDYKDMLCILKKHQIRFIIIGAYALAAHGYPRSTSDIDIWVDVKDDNPKKVYNALMEFGAPLTNIDETTFSKKGIVFQIGTAPCRIDILTQISGDIKFQDAIEHAAKYKIDGIDISILSIDDLIKNKKATGRAKDLEDAKRLEDIK